ncbi:MAG TPA: CsbD family protein [Polyangiaceae bacterium]|nr:CsbD family protein [Polyangiaceae bacterium]
MGTLKHQARGATERLVGRAKQAAGKVLDRPDLEAEGERVEAVGEARSALADAFQLTKKKMGKAGEQVKAGVERVVGDAAKKVAELTERANEQQAKPSNPSRR